MVRSGLLLWLAAATCRGRRRGSEAQLNMVKISRRMFSEYNLLLFD